MALQLTPAIEQRVESLAERLQRSPSAMAEEALQEFCSSREELLALIKQGDEDFERGDFYTTEEVYAHIQEIFSSK